jgi:hypothetical protein
MAGPAPGGSTPRARAATVGHEPTSRDAHFRELAELRRVGALNEAPTGAAFGTMLKSWGRGRDPVFLQQQPIPGTRGRDVRPGGLLRHSIRLDFGVWEVWREGVDLDAAIAAKKERGCPLWNTIFGNGATAAPHRRGPRRLSGRASPLRGPRSRAAGRRWRRSAPTCPGRRRRRAGASTPF